MRAPGEAVIAIKSAALNFFDILMIQGECQIKPPFPFSPAAEVAGVIESVGAGVTDLKAGDRVVGVLRAQWRAREDRAAGQFHRQNSRQSRFRSGRGYHLIYGTALHALKDRASLKAGETLAVLGASGGTGLAAFELGKLMGPRVIACASSEEKLAFAKQRGAD